MGSEKWSNFSFPIFLACFKFVKRMKINILEIRATRLKSKFGIDYLTLISSGANFKKLQVRLGPTMEKFYALQDQIEELEESIKEKEKQIHERLGVVAEVPPPPPKLVEKPPISRLPPPPPVYRVSVPPVQRRKSQMSIESALTCSIAMDGSIKATEKPKNKKKKSKRKQEDESPTKPGSSQSLTYLNIDDSGNTSLVFLDDSLHVMNEPKPKKRKSKSKQNGRKRNSRTRTVSAQ